MQQKVYSLYRVAYSGKIVSFKIGLKKLYYDIMRVTKKPDNNLLPLSILLL